MDPSLHSLAASLEGELLTESFDRAFWSTDASLYQIQPRAVLLPKSAADVAAAHRWAAHERCPIIPRGGGTSLSGQSIGPGLVIDFSKHMNRILELDPHRAVARVQPGVTLDQINGAAKPFALQFGPDVSTSSRANLGGMLGNNSAGSRSIFQGKTVDHILEMNCQLADGSSVTFGPKTPAQVAALAAEPTLEGAIYRQFPKILAQHKDEVLARFPRLLRRVSGYNLDEFLSETRAWFPTPSAVARLRQIEAERYPGANFNFARLIAGAEGTLATVTEMLVHLVPLPPCRGLLVLHFESIRGAVSTVPAAVAAGASAVELFDRQIVDLARESLEYKHYLDFVIGSPETLLLVELAGNSADEVTRQMEQVCRDIEGTPDMTHVLRILDPAECDRIWACRKAAQPLLMGVPGVRKPVAFVEDTAVSPDRLPEFVARFRQIMRNHGTDGAFYGHASVGCLHIRPCLDTANRDDLVHLRQISEEICALVMEFGGAMSGEHGDGLARSYLNERLFGSQLYQAFREVKSLFDPTGLMNPGKIVEGPSPTESLRTRSDQGPIRFVEPQKGEQATGGREQPNESTRGAGCLVLGSRPQGPTLPPQPNTQHLTPSTSPSPLPLLFDWSKQGGFAQAVDNCNGSGVCRKTQTGTMCPSFMATGDEQHSTRGRANALRQVLSGALPAAELTGQHLHDTFALCLQCKGCKAECPSNVDVGKMKAEFLQLYHTANGASLGTRLMANVHRLNRLGSALAPISNWLARLPGAALLQEKLFGVDRRRPLPVFHREHFARWFGKRGARDEGREASKTIATSSNRPSSLASRPSVILLDDCLTSFCEPHVNRAAVQVLEACGFTVHLAGLPCCGRAMISKGMLREARDLALANVRHLLAQFPADVPIVGTEPSCILTLADDYRDLIPGPEADAIAARSHLLDDFLVRSGALDRLGRIEGGNSDQVSSPPSSILNPSSLPTVLLHGHCHQKALVGLASTRTLLERAGYQVRVVDSGCCGMAGSFGYEHYDLSMKIGERVLFPAVRKHCRVACDSSVPPAESCGAGAPPACPALNPVRTGEVAAPGFSCRHQIDHGAGVRAKHPLELLAERLSAS